MNKNTLIISLVVALLVGGMIGYSIAPKGEEVNLGAANASTTVISYYSALSKQVLWDVLNSMMIDINRTNAPLQSILTATTTWTPGALTGIATTTTVSVTGATIGDIVLISNASSTLETIFTYGYVSAANVVTLVASNSSTTASTVNATTFGIKVIPVASLVDPAAIRTTTSTSF